MIRSATVFRIALVLAGGAARGAYEVGVLQYLLEDVARELGRPVPLDILCGTSVGAINACFLAGAADDEDRSRRLVGHWLRMRVGHVVRMNAGTVWQAFRGRGGLLDPTGLGRIVATAIPWGKISENLRAGRIEALSVSTTHVGTGKTVIYVDRAAPGDLRWPDPTTVVRTAEVTAAHALASAAIPFLFPAVKLDGEYHCDGGLRQNVPLSPARRLGASAMVVISPKYESTEPAPDEVAVDHEPEVPGNMFMLGKTLNALMLDRIDNDIERLQRISAILDAGARVYGPDFVDRISAELGKPLRPIEAVLIRASQDISRMAVDFVRSPAFASRASGVVAALFRRLAEAHDSDVLSYLLFDGEYARMLMEVGRGDARARHDELCALFDRVLKMRA